MNDDLVMITCERCQTRLRVKPGLLKVMKTIKCSKCGNPIPVANAAPPAPAREEPRPEVQPVPEKIESPAVPVEPVVLADPNKDAELESLRVKLRAAEQELAESDARISDLQEQWHSKEIEIREMAARLQKAEGETRRAIAIRDEFLAKARNELAVYLVGERDSALSRFSEMEKRLMELHPSMKNH